MSQSFSYELSVSGSPAKAQARVRDAVTERMQEAARMRLAKQDPNSLSFRPEWSWPLLAALFRVVAGEAVTLNFSASDRGTRVTVTGKVGAEAEQVADRDFWAQTLRTD